MKKILLFLLLLINIYGEENTGNKIKLNINQKKELEEYKKSESQEIEKQIWSDIILGYGEREYGINKNDLGKDYKDQYGNKLKFMLRQRYGSNQIGAGLEYVMFDNKKAGFVYLISYDRYFSIISNKLYIYSGFELNYGDWKLELEDDSSTDNFKIDGSWLGIDLRVGIELNLFNKLILGGSLNYGWGTGKFEEDRLSVKETYISVYIGWELGYDMGLKEKYY